MHREMVTGDLVGLPLVPLVLLVGGRFDGRRVADNGELILDVPVKGRGGDTVAWERYRRISVGVQNRDEHGNPYGGAQYVTYLRFVGLSEVDAVRRLLDHYPMPAQYEGPKP